MATVQRMMRTWRPFAGDWTEETLQGDANQDSKVWKMRRCKRKQRQVIVYWVVFSFCLNDHPFLGKIPTLTNIFQWGWFNHQLVSEILQKLDLRYFGVSNQNSNLLPFHPGVVLVTSAFIQADSCCWRRWWFLGDSIHPTGWKLAYNARNDRTMGFVYLRTWIVDFYGKCR